MMFSDKRVKALGLCSGGLDSILSALVLRNQGIHVEWTAFETPFFSTCKAEQAAGALNIPLAVKNITSVYIPMLKNPPRGYGKHMNPCMDCHALMFKEAGLMMKERGFDFLFSGEVLGQRPLSQNKGALGYVEKASGWAGRILRPLSARCLPETPMEQEQLVDRSRLPAICGRGRKEQMALAEQFKVTDYPSPAGGCLLTDKHFSIRLKDLLDHQTTYPENELHLLKYGRHFRLDDGTKLIVGRTKKDNDNIMGHINRSVDVLIHTAGHPGPVLVIPCSGSSGKNRNPEVIRQAASVCVGYGKARQGEPAEVIVKTPEGTGRIRVDVVDRERFRRYLI